MCLAPPPAAPLHERRTRGEQAVANTGNGSHIMCSSTMNDEETHNQRRQQPHGDKDGLTSSFAAADDDTDVTVKPHASTAALATLCLCMLTQSYLLISVFPYSGYLVLHLVPTATPETAGRYAGLVAAALMMGRATTAVAWGHAADTYGRTSVLYLSLLSSAVLSICFGLAPSLKWAIAMRFLLGTCNGIIGTIKTAVSELAGDANEAQWMTIVIGMWSWGFLLSPAISGALAEPLQQYPDATWLHESCVLQPLLTRFPFVLPNLLGAVLCLLTFVAVTLFIPESLPAHKRQSVRSLPGHVIRTLQSYLCCFRCQKASYRQLPLKAHPSDVGMSEENTTSRQTEKEAMVASMTLSNSPPSPTPPSMLSILKRPQTRAVLLIYWFNSFVTLTSDEVFPLFAMSREAGLGLAESSIGKVLSGCGLLFAVSQYHVYQWIYRRWGLYGTIRIGAAVAAPLFLFTPAAVWLARAHAARFDASNPSEFMDTPDAPRTLPKVVFAYLAIVLASTKVATLLFFSSISVAVNRSVPASQMATTNGLAMLGGSVAKSLGPLLAGWLVTQSVAWCGPSGSLLMYGVLGVLGASLTLACYAWLGDEEVVTPTTSVETSYELVPVVEAPREELDEKDRDCESYP